MKLVMTFFSLKVSELEAVNSQLKIELESETKNRKSETEVLAKKLADTVKQLESAKQKAKEEGYFCEGQSCWTAFCSFSVC